MMKRSVVKLTVYTLRKRYSGTRIGIFWSILTPLIQSIYYIFLFGFVFKQRYEIGGLSYLSWFLSGFSAWFFFNETLINSLSLFMSNASLIKNFKISKLDLVLSSVITSVPYLFIFGFLSILFQENITLNFFSISLSIFAYCSLVLISLNCHIIFSLIGLSIPDSKYAIPNILQIFLFTTNAVIPDGTFPAPISYLIKYNPLSIIFSTIRAGFGQEIEPYYVFLNIFLFSFLLFCTKFLTKRFNRLSNQISSAI